MGNGLVDLAAAAVHTGRTYRSLVRLHQRGLLESVGTDDRGRLLFDFHIIDRLLPSGKPSELLAA